MKLSIFCQLFHRVLIFVQIHCRSDPNLASLRLFHWPMWILQQWFCMLSPAPSWCAIPAVRRTSSPSTSPPCSLSLQLLPSLASPLCLCCHQWLKWCKWPHASNWSPYQYFTTGGSEAEGNGDDLPAYHIATGKIPCKHCGKQERLCRAPPEKTWPLELPCLQERIHNFQRISPTHCQSTVQPV